MVKALIIVSCFIAAYCKAQETVALQKVNGVPDTLGATISVHLPTTKISKRSAVIFCPGGGYSTISYNVERRNVVDWLVQKGLCVFVLRYRHGGIKQYYPAPMDDVKAAMNWIQQNTLKYGIDSNRVGIMGTSAGGHLAAFAATRFNETKTVGSFKPLSFCVLLYPVMNLSDPTLAHEGSRKNLIGPRSDSAQVANELSIEQNIGGGTPPVFIVYGGDDRTTPPENGAVLYLALRKARIPVELHLFQTGPHAFGLPVKDALSSTWNMLLEAWLKKQKIL